MERFSREERLSFEELVQQSDSQKMMDILHIFQTHLWLH